MHSTKIGCLGYWLFVVLMNYSQQIVPNRECHNAKSGLKLLDTVNNEYLFARADVDYDSLSKCVEQCFGVLYCANLNFGMQKDAGINVKFVDQLKKIRSHLCQEIENGKNMIEAVKSVENDAINLMAHLNKNADAKQNIQKFVENVLQNELIKEKIRKLLQKFKFNSFPDALNATYKQFSAHHKNGQLQSLRRRRKRADDIESAAAGAVQGPLPTKCKFYLAVIIISMFGIAMSGYELFKLSDNFLWNNAAFLGLLIISIVAMLAFLMIMFQQC